MTVICIAYSVLVCVAVIWEGDRHISDVLSSESLSEHTCKDIFIFHNYDFFSWPCHLTQYLSCKQWCKVVHSCINLAVI